MKRQFLFILMFASIYLSCTSWKTSDLKSAKLFSIKGGNGPGEISISADEYALKGLTFSFKVFEDTVIAADNDLKRIQIFNKEGEPKLLIGGPKIEEKDKLLYKPFNFSVIGSCTMDANENIYIQNRLSTPRERRSYPESLDFTPSYILVFNNKGDLQYTLGQEGTPDIPFYYIEDLMVDSKGRLLVISRSFDSWNLYRYKGKKREVAINLGKLKFEEEDEGAVFSGKIENIRIFRTGNKILLSVAYYQNLRLKYRRLYEYSVEDNRLIRSIVRLPDPKNVLFNLVDDTYIYLWDMDRDRVRYQVRNMEGEIVKNFALKKVKSGTVYSQVFPGNNGAIYSCHATREKIDLYRWE